MGKKILQFVGSFHLGGSERQAVQLARLLRNDGEFDIEVATLDKSGVLLEEIEKAGFSDIREFRLKSFLSIGFIRRVLECAAYLRDNSIDIVHTHDFYTNVFGILAAKLAGIPIRIASKRETKGIRSAAQERVERFVYRLSTAITVNSNAVRRFLTKKGVPEDKLKLIYNGLDLERLKPEITDRNKICGEIGLPVDKRFVTIVANLRHGVKNQAMLLRCARFLRDGFEDIHFVFAGEGERKGFHEDMAKKLGVEKRTHFIERCRMIPELLYVSEICVLTSYSEGFSNSILEYMAAGKPVVATDVGGASESIEAGGNGFLVQSDDAKEMADKLAILIADPELGLKFGKRGREIVESSFSTEIQLAEAKKTYNELLSAVS